LGNFVLTVYYRIIPTGWIHAVFTPEDAIVIGGNFLHTFNVTIQLKVHEIEEATDVPMKFRFPFYKKINWYALAKYGQWLKAKETTYSNYELESVLLLARFLREEVVKSNLTLGADGMITSSAKKSHQIPESIHDPIALTKHVEDLAKKALIAKIDSLKKKESPSEEPAKQQRPIIRLTFKAKRPTTPPPLPREEEEPAHDDYDYEEDAEEDEEDEEDWKIAEELEEDDDDEYQEDPDAPVEYNTMMPVISDNNHQKKKPQSRKRKRAQVVIESKDTTDSSDDEDCMGTRKKSTKSSSSTRSSSGRKRSLSNNSNSSQPSSAKQRILGMINNKRY
jgi:F-box/leucine-rich repeat protein 10/11